MNKPKKILFINSVLKIYSNNNELVSIDRINEPIQPAIVLLGLMEINLGPLKTFPKSIPPISEDIHINNITNKIILK
tara:strand:+ start:1215 stop:1445 length:231 start_codon:yes stop_codon:yes gene_type:complete